MTRLKRNENLSFISPCQRLLLGWKVILCTGWCHDGNTVPVSHLGRLNFWRSVGAQSSSQPGRSNCNPFEFWDYQIASPSLQSTWKSNIIVLISNFSVLCLFIYYLFPGCGPTQHSAKGCAPNEFMAAEIQFHFNTLHQKCLFEDYLQYQHQTKFNQDMFKKSSAKRQLLHFMSRCQVDLKRSAPDWPKAFWCTYWGPNMEPRVCLMSRR
jgi:hypothetical protein